MPPDEGGHIYNENVFLSSLKVSLAEDEEWNEMGWKDLIQFYQEDYICR